MLMWNTSEEGMVKNIWVICQGDVSLMHSIFEVAFIIKETGFLSDTFCQIQTQGIPHNIQLHSDIHEKDDTSLICGKYTNRSVMLPTSH